jgi:hypothetical protein
MRPVYQADSCFLLDFLFRFVSFLDGFLNNLMALGVDWSYTRTMLKLRSALLAGMICAWALSGVAQDEEPNYNTQQNADLIENWLHGSDPRLVAFGARFASESDDEGEITAMLQLVANWNAPQRYPDADHVLAMSEILHALIARKIVVPAEDVSAVATYFPNQAVILASRLPLDEATPLLQRWYDGGESLDQDRVVAPQDKPRRLLLARMAAMMLVKAPPAGFAASLLAQSEERLGVSVNNEGQRGAEYTGASAEDSRVCPEEVADQPRANWPPLFQYNLEENAGGGDDDWVVAQAGGDTITYRRSPANLHVGYCYAPRALTSVTRHRLLAEMLGEEERAMLWQPHKSVSLVWKGKEQFEADLGTKVGQEEAKLRATVNDFYAKGLLTMSEVDSTRPRLAVLVYDHRNQPASIALPQLAVRDSRTAFAVSP